MNNVKYDMCVEHLALIYNICDGIVASLNGSSEYMEDTQNYRLAVDVILGIDTHGNAYQPLGDEIHFVRYIVGKYAESVYEQHEIAQHLDEQAIAWDEYTLASDLCRRLNQPHTVH